MRLKKTTISLFWFFFEITKQKFFFHKINKSQTEHRIGSSSSRSESNTLTEKIFFHHLSEYRFSFQNCRRQIHLVRILTTQFSFAEHVREENVSKGKLFKLYENLYGKWLWADCVRFGSGLPKAIADEGEWMIFRLKELSRGESHSFGETEEKPTACGKRVKWVVLCYQYQEHFLCFAVLFLFFIHLLEKLSFVSDYEHTMILYFFNFIFLFHSSCFASCTSVHSQSPPTN